jgi:hypothetical protein
VCGSEIKDGRASLQDKFKITPYDKNILKLFLSETTKALTADMADMLFWMYLHQMYLYVFVLIRISR